MPQPDHKGQSQLSLSVLKKLHGAKRHLCLDDDDYRDLLERVTGHRSAVDVTPDQLPALQRELRRLGWQGYLLTREEWKEQQAGKPAPHKKYEELGIRPKHPSPAQLRKLDALFNGIPGYGTINQAAAMRGFLKKRFGVEHIRFLDLDQFEKALHAVRQMRARKGLTDEHLTQGR